MASIGDLVRAVAEASDLDEASVKIVARYLREAGFIGQRSTGAGAARMNAADASSLLIAVNASPLAKDAAQTVATYGNLPLNYISKSHAEGEEYEDLNRSFGQRLRFDQALSFLLGFYSEDELTCASLEFLRPSPQVFVRIWVAKSDDDLGQNIAHCTYRPEISANDGFSDRRIATTIGDKTLRYIAKAIST